MTITEPAPAPIAPTDAFSQQGVSLPNGEQALVSDTTPGARGHLIERQDQNGNPYPVPSHTLRTDPRAVEFDDAGQPIVTGIAEVPLENGGHAIVSDATPGAESYMLSRTDAEGNVVEETPRRVYTYPSGLRTDDDTEELRVHVGTMEPHQREDKTEIRAYQGVHADDNTEQGRVNDEAFAPAASQLTTPEVHPALADIKDKRPSVRAARMAWRGTKVVGQKHLGKIAPKPVSENEDHSFMQDDFDYGTNKLAEAQSDSRTLSRWRIAAGKVIDMVGVGLEVIKDRVKPYQGKHVASSTEGAAAENVEVPKQPTSEPMISKSGNVRVYAASAQAVDSDKQSAVGSDSGDGDVIKAFDTPPDHVDAIEVSGPGAEVIDMPNQRRDIGAVDMNTALDEPQVYRLPSHTSSDKPVVPRLQPLPWDAEGNPSIPGTDITAWGARLDKAIRQSDPQAAIRAAEAQFRLSSDETRQSTMRALSQRLLNMESPEIKNYVASLAQREDVRGTDIAREIETSVDRIDLVHARAHNDTVDALTAANDYLAHPTNESEEAKIRYVSNMLLGMRDPVATAYVETLAQQDSIKGTQLAEQLEEQISQAA